MLPHVNWVLLWLNKQDSVRRLIEVNHILHESKDIPYGILGSDIYAWKLM